MGELEDRVEIRQDEVEGKQYKIIEEEADIEIELVYSKNVR